MWKELQFQSTLQLVQTCSIVVGHIKSPHEWLGSGHSPSRRCIWNETTCVSQLKAGKHQKSLCNLPTLKIVNASGFFECEVLRRTIMKLLCLIEVLKVCGCYLVTFLYIGHQCLIVVWFGEAQRINIIIIFQRD